jgi:hypothetical protein
MIRVGVCAVAALLVLGFASTAAGASSASYSVGAIRQISAGCGGQNAEVEQAVDSVRGYVYDAWIGCNGIGFARSTDGGFHFKKPIRFRDSGGAWDPAVTVAPDGTVYAAYMVTRGARALPVVLRSSDHGASFRHRTYLPPRRSGNWGDRVFIASGPGRKVYVTWDYGPKDSSVKLKCFAAGSCALTSGQLNIVFQASTDAGRRFGHMVPVSPGFPNSGADSAPLLVEPGGRIDLLYEGSGPSRRTAVSAGHEYFTSSSDGGHTWRRPVAVGPSAGGLSSYGWWIDGSIASDAAGNLYATWDTQGRRNDIGWVSYSTDHGATWSAPTRVTPDHAKVPHIVQVAGGRAGIAYVAWLTPRPHQGYAEYLRTFSIANGWLSPPKRISRHFGRPRVWPGDTFGISSVSPTKVVISWGSAIPSTRGNSEIFAVPISVTLP